MSEFHSALSGEYERRHAESLEVTRASTSEHDEKEAARQHAMRRDGTDIHELFGEQTDFVSDFLEVAKSSSMSGSEEVLLDIISGQEGGLFRASSPDQKEVVRGYVIGYETLKGYPALDYVSRYPKVYLCEDQRLRTERKAIINWLGFNDQTGTGNGAINTWLEKVDVHIGMFVHHRERPRVYSGEHTGMAAFTEFIPMSITKLLPKIAADNHF